MGVLTVLDVNHSVPLESVVAIDDSDSAVSSADHAASWRRWLQMGNAFAGADQPVALVTSTSTLLPGVDSTVAADLRRREALVRVAPEWASLVEEVGSDPGADLVAALAQRGVGAPLYGEELSDGIPVDFVWPDQRVVVVLDVDEETARDLAAAGWRVVNPDVEAIVEALRAPEGVR